MSKHICWHNKEWDISECVGSVLFWLTVTHSTHSQLSDTTKRTNTLPQNCIRFNVFTLKKVTFDSAKGKETNSALVK